MEMWENSGWGIRKMAVAIMMVVVVVSGLTSSLGLRVTEKGEFKIVQVADMHYADGKATACLDVLSDQAASCSDLNTTAFLRRIIRAENPDLIVFTGDNIFASDSTNVKRSLDAAFAPAVESRIPWAAVLGNHDQQSTLTREGLMRYIVRMKNTVSLVNPRTTTAIDGFGNYNHEVFGVAGSRFENVSVLNLYFVDSGDFAANQSISKYDWIKPSQQTWFRNTSSELKRKYTSLPEAQMQPAPGLVYFHIPLPEYEQFDASNITGEKQEWSGAPKINSGFFGNIVEAGDVKAVFVGHAHLNDFCGNLSGVELCYGGGFGYHAYGKAGWPRRARVVLASLTRSQDNLSWGGVHTIQTWKRLDDPNFSIIDKQTLWQKQPSQKVPSSGKEIARDIHNMWVLLAITISFFLTLDKRL